MMIPIGALGLGGLGTTGDGLGNIQDKDIEKLLQRWYVWVQIEEKTYIYILDRFYIYIHIYQTDLEWFGPSTRALYHQMPQVCLLSSKSSDGNGVGSSPTKQLHIELVEGPFPRFQGDLTRRIPDGAWRLAMAIRIGAQEDVGDDGRAQGTCLHCEEAHLIIL